MIRTAAAYPQILGVAQFVAHLACDAMPAGVRPRAMVEHIRDLMLDPENITHTSELAKRLGGSPGSVKSSPETGTDG